MVPGDCCFYVYCVNGYFYRKKRDKSTLKATLNNPEPNIAHWATPKTRSSLVSKCRWNESFVVYLSCNHNLISMKRG